MSGLVCDAVRDTKSGAGRRHESVNQILNHPSQPHRYRVKRPEMLK